MSLTWTTQKHGDTTVSEAVFGIVTLVHGELPDGGGVAMIFDNRNPLDGGTYYTTTQVTRTAAIARRIAERLAERLETPVPLNERFHGGNRVDYWVTIPGLVGVRVDARATVIDVHPEVGRLTIQPDAIRYGDDDIVFRPPGFVVGDGTRVPLSRVTVRY